jgi:hypothetical protein
VYRPVCPVFRSVFLNRANRTGSGLGNPGPHVEGGGSRRLGKQRRAKEAADWAEVGGPGRPPMKEAQAGRPNPFRGQVAPPFDLDASRAIYSPLTESHATINSSSAAEEQRSLRDTISEMRVVLVV